MFACSTYPADDAFLENVRLEVRQNVRRIQHHPSIALWATNNENEVAIQQNWYSINGNKNLYVEDYKKLYVETIALEVEKKDKWRTMLISSPWNGNKSV